MNAYLKIYNELLQFIFAVSLLVFTACSSSQNGSELSSNVREVHVPEGYEVEIAAGSDLVDYPMFGMVDETGRLFLFESTGNVYEESEEAINNPQFHIKLLEDENGDGIYDKSTIYADKVGFPQGGVFYKGSLYASSAPDLLKFTDTDGDGVADEREVLLSGWVLNVNANSLIGPFMGPDGWLYMTNAIEGFDVTTQEGERLKGETARIWRVRPDGSDLEWISAGGMNNPVELTFTEAGEPIGTETYFTNPRAGQRDALVYWIEGGVYPKPNNNISRDGLVRTGELMPVVSKYSRVAPSGIGRYRHTGLGEDFKDNLFSAQFNTHRVLRHKLLREDASFLTEDEIFFWSDHEDFHPTDVLEDADGSLLVVETGGWFIKGCPLSQVSKPELEGAIYRVRRKGADKVDDPYGNQIQWPSLSPAEVASLLEDPRPFVCDRAVQWVVDQGTDAVDALTDLLHNSSAVNARTKAVFALYRIGTEEALASVRTALEDADLQVRVAAARSVGLAKDTKAVDKLMEILREDEPAVHRQAATALGQINDSRAIPALLEAAEGTDDRFINHAITYALVIMNEPEMVAQGLTHHSPDVQAAALIALDQMAVSPLQADQLLPYLASNDNALQRTALWVASHHPEWSAEMMAFLRSRFQKQTSLTEEEKELLGDILVSFCGNDRMQQFMVEQMQGASTARKLFLMDAMARCNIEEFPQNWIVQVGQQLTASSEPEVQASALELVRLRSIPSLAPQLQKVVEDNQTATALRIEALGALTALQPDLTDQHFNFLYDQLQEDKEAPVRQQAASVLAQAELSEEQLVKLGEYLNQVDAFMLSRLLPVFEGAYSSQIGEKLATTLMSSPSLDNFTEENVQAIFAEYPEEIKPKVDQLISKLHEVRADRLERIQALESHIEEGDMERGRTLFFGKAICSTCHTLGDEGVKLGPDLTSIQKDRSAHDILEAIVYPSVSFVREYETYRIKTNTNEYTGIIQQQAPDAIVLGTSPQTSVRIPRDEIVSTEILDVSMMPQSLDQLLTTQEMADLMAFILGQDQDPESDERFLR